MDEKQVLRCRVVTRGPEETRALGVRLGQVAEAGDVFLLEGEFGAGKTVMVQGLAQGLGVATFVSSPSFVIVNQHQGRLTLYHVDLYRIEQHDPEIEATVADLLDAGGVVAIEWPRLLIPELRAEATVVRFSRRDEQQRVLEVETPVARVARAVEAALASGEVGRCEERV